MKFVPKVIDREHRTLILIGRFDFIGRKRDRDREREREGERERERERARERERERG